MPRKSYRLLLKPKKVGRFRLRDGIGPQGIQTYDNDTAQLKLSCSRDLDLDYIVDDPPEKLVSLTCLEGYLSKPVK